MEHPLSLILFLFKKFTKFQIITNVIIYKKRKFLEKIKFHYLLKKKVAIEINLKNKKKRRIYLFKENKLIFFADLNNYKIKNKKNSLFSLYNSLLSKKKPFYQSLDFYKKILVQRVNILNSLQSIII